jgi:hypothetical protein
MVGVWARPVDCDNCDFIQLFGLGKSRCEESRSGDKTHPKGLIVRRKIFFVAIGIAFNRVL